MKVEDNSEQTIKSYVRAIDRLIRFHGLIRPKELDIDEVLDFLVSLTEHRKVNWRTNSKVTSFFQKLHRYTIATSSALIQNTRSLAQASV